MKKVFLFGLIIFSLLIFGQDKKENLERDLITYHQLISEKKIELSLEYIDPIFFEIIPKEQLKTLMETALNFPNIEYKMSLPNIKEIREIKRINQINYVKIKYISPFEIKFNDLNENQIPLMLNLYENKFGQKNVTYDKETGFFKINAHKEIIATSIDSQENWKFIVIDNPKIKPLLEKILPNEILN